ncbi:hypothetical protein NEMIN01_1380 [Nematocida minor]|uniref:uncharacterized protein n=1 Tax=Nematocida minor TaxID=1912983 RepID=UPI0022211AE4|nr:uncharacterized protein NEMIN01_1380 [Nematocida minor]KAI5191111.1 hypothetical protein NEMIN01_1380 [Nematocida minor]
MVRNISWYIYEFKAYTKERWVGRKLVDVLSSEFKRRSPVYFRKAVLSGSIEINGCRVSEEYSLKQGDLITHKTHRHEPPIPTDEISTVFENQDIIVVDKPSGIPCHPNSAYNKNSLTEILKSQHSLRFVSALNRLDKQTSGVVILAKSSEAAVKYHKKIEEKEGFKIYLCRVKRGFPEREVIVNLPLSISRKRCITTIFEKDGVFQGKKSTTIFRKIGEAGEEDILACGLVTGRTHQIRVHLQAIGYPIVDDMVYSQPYIEPSLFCKSIQNLTEKRRASYENKDENMHSTEIKNENSVSTDAPSIEITEEVYLDIAKEASLKLEFETIEQLISTEECRTDDFQDNDLYLSGLSTENISQFITDSCMYCRNAESLVVMPKFSTLSLHAWKYTLDEHVFKTMLPEWCVQEIDETICAEIERTKTRITGV